MSLLNPSTHCNDYYLIIKHYLSIPKRFNYHFKIILTPLHTFQLRQLLHSDSLDYHSLDFMAYIGLNIAISFLDPYLLLDTVTITATTHTSLVVANVAFALKKRVLPRPYLDVIIVNFNYFREAQYGHLIDRLLLALIELD